MPAAAVAEAEERRSTSPHAPAASGALPDDDSVLLTGASARPQGRPRLVTDDAAVSRC